MILVSYFKIIHANGIELSLLRFRNLGDQVLVPERSWQISGAISRQHSGRLKQPEMSGKIYKASAAYFSVTYLSHRPDGSKHDRKLETRPTFFPPTTVGCCRPFWLRGVNEPGVVLYRVESYTPAAVQLPRSFSSAY